MQNFGQANTNYGHMSAMKLKQQLRRRRRSRKRAQIKQSFYCGCGRVYLSFSALYLHAKNKHDLKLTLKKESQVYKMEQIEGLTKFVYSLPISKQIVHVQKMQSLLSHEEDENTLKQSSQKEICQIEKDVLDFYIESIESQQEGIVIKQFIRYANSQDNSSTLTKNERTRSLPLFLNSFLLDFLPKASEIQVSTSKGRQVCFQLHRFCSWLQYQGLTDIQVLYNFE